MPAIPFNLFGVFHGGLNTRDDPRDLPLHKSPYLRNVELRNRRVETTPGATPHSGTDSDTAANLGLFVATYSGGIWLIKAENGKLKKLKVVGSSPDSAWATLKTGLNTTARYEFAQAGNVVYATNGVDTVQKWDLATTPGSTSDAAGVPKGTTITAFNQRLVVNDPTDPNKLNLSDVGAYETFSAFKYADRGEGGAIKKVLDTGRGVLLILKDNGRFTWDGVDTSTSNPKKWSSRGTIAPRSVVMLPSGEVAFCDHEGVWAANIYDYGERLLSDEIGPTWRDLNHGKLDLAAGHYHNDQYLLSVAESGSTTNNVSLVLDLQLDGGRGGWLYHTFLGATAWASYIDSSGVLQLIYGYPSATSKVYRRYQGLTSSEFNDNGASYRAEYRTKELDAHEVVPGSAGRLKAFARLVVSTEQKGDYDMFIGWRKDNDTDFLDALWDLFGTGSSLWSDTPNDYWTDTPTSDDVWEGTQKVEGSVVGFNVTGRTIQLRYYLQGANQPFTLYGVTIFIIPLNSLT